MGRLEAAGGAQRGARLTLSLFLGAACPATPFEGEPSALRRSGIVANTHAPRTRQLEQLATSMYLPTHERLQNYMRNFYGTACFNLIRTQHTSVTTAPRGRHSKLTGKTNHTTIKTTLINIRWTSRDWLPGR